MRPRTAALAAALLATSALAAAPTPPADAPMKKLTPILFVEAIEPCLPFWTERLGFEVTAEVPHEDRLGFVILTRGGVEIMYQTGASAEADIPGVTEGLVGAPAMLFVEVDAIDPLEPALEGVEVVVPRRTTFYGMDEIFVRSPCGSIVGFAARTGDGEG